MQPENRIRGERVQLYRAMVGLVKRPFMWRQLCARIKGVLQMDDALIQRVFVVNMKMQPGGDGFTLDRPAYPKARVTATFQANLLIEVHCSHQKTDNAPTVEWEFLIEMPVDELDRVYFQFQGDIVSEDDAALLILAPVRDPKFKRPE